ncbi:hypothetical protein [Mannheimia haemolytica]|uniref:hypothetical protein n=1 Tax=Mannheimia haemolytica TaxID=75985 RepID=UPI0003862E3B|nr:hypothetical protein [Mannheimia haemolytica]EPY98838.1 hypothetical protein L278_12210 [Mannheimia haemolytica D35]MDW1151009.1 hypothetical protein [Mannheimia haemolytica]MDW1161167.1 hypothetical protein [Mannheimia haemolytica]NBB68648.1 hypothetical protein [Mannheimia haemolytica]TRC46656.1 hypothetical protein FEA40_11680 [Mannheimia haemolytica]
MVKPKPNLQEAIGKLWDTVSVLTLLSKVNIGSGQDGDFQGSLDLISKSLADTVSEIQDLTGGEQ